MTALGPQTVVLDTNVALALWLFRDPRLAQLDAALRDGTLLWLQCAATRSELAREIRAERCERYGIQAQHVEAVVDSLPMRWCDAPVPKLTHRPGLRCTDPDDQIFIDLALAEGAAWLLTRDKALLKLRSRARQSGLVIDTPQAWPGKT
jgi:uncharacterized protein